MAQPFTGEIRMFAGNFAPSGWALCDGQLVSISQNDALFSLLGSTYGGDGQTTFALPDFRGRIPIHQGTGFPPGAASGSETVTLTAIQMPGHTHPLVAADEAGNQTSPAGNVPAQSFNVVPYINDSPVGDFNSNALTAAGGSQPHSNLQPFLCVNFIIALFGIFPSRL